MGNTLKRKKLRKKMEPTALQNEIKRLNAKPVIRKVDVEELKKSFAK